MELLDYLSWRNDVAFSTAAFNEIDNVILSFLSYVDFGELCDCGNSMHEITEMYELFCENHSMDDIRKNAEFSQRAPLLMPDMAAGERFRKTRVGYYFEDFDKEKVKQFAAMVFILPDGTNYIAFRGTDCTITGWKEDFLMSCMSETEGAKEAVRYLNQVAEHIPGDLILGGHSKGGNFAMYAAAFCEDSIKSRITRIYNNDGPGFRDEIIDTVQYKEIVPRIVNIVPETSIIGQLLSNEGRQTVIKSKGRVFFQHDAMNWEVTKDKFEPSELDSFSRFVKAALGTWLEKMDDETRQSVVTTVFSMIEETESETFREFGGNLFKNSEIVLKELVKLPKDKKKELISALGSLITSSGGTAIDKINSIVGSKDIFLNVKTEIET
ncbi:Protein of unknown function (DUF2974) [Lachnospiraceae bacterium JC7]|nr:Protein of unknown function (DUF2974) [Lachnospiraceae bacterium JC7]